MPSFSDIKQWWRQITVVEAEKLSVWTGHSLIMIVAQRYMPQKKSYDQMGDVSRRLLELLHHLKHKGEYKKRTEIALVGPPTAGESEELVQQIAEEGNFPDANYAFDNGMVIRSLS